MIYSVDYPFVGNAGSRAFLAGSGLSKDAHA